ncbi:MAG: ABC transporter permease subunit [Proteobacteria bacterium]|nr:ABC transporter permease subunit [Pseudomonadota bacterium]
MLLALAVLVLWLAGNARANLQALGSRTGFGFLGEPAGFDIPQTLVAYSPQSTHARVFLVGALNTLLVAGLGVVFATALGLLAGLLRLSRNFLGRSLATVYVEAVRNTPLPIQLLIWFNLLLLAPPPARALQLLPGVHLTNRGLFFPWAGTAPRLEGFGFMGGAALSPALTALLAALVVYTGAFIAEVVRGGIQAVSPGQSEAARALGLREAGRLRLVVLPQALRVMIPPLASQYLNLTKNSSLAIVVGYPDLVSVFGNTSLTRTGQAIESIALIMLFYLAVSLLISLALNGWNARLARGDRP